jgi:hypothetical protein
MLEPSVDVDRNHVLGPPDTERTGELPQYALFRNPALVTVHRAAPGSIHDVVGSFAAFHADMPPRTLVTSW